jgi:hypothetical protein
LASSPRWLRQSRALQVASLASETQRQDAPNRPMIEASRFGGYCDLSIHPQREWSRARRQPDSRIGHCLSAVGTLEHQRVRGTLAFCAGPIKGTNHVAPHRHSYRALSLRGFRSGGPDVEFRPVNFVFLRGRAKFRRDRAQGLSDESLRAANKRLATRRISVPQEVETLGG